MCHNGPQTVCSFTLQTEVRHGLYLLFLHAFTDVFINTCLLVFHCPWLLSTFPHSTLIHTHCHIIMDTSEVINRLRNQPPIESEATLTLKYEFHSFVYVCVSSMWPYWLRGLVNWRNSTSNYYKLSCVAIETIYVSDMWSVSPFDGWISTHAAQFPTHFSHCVHVNELKKIRFL